MPFATNILVSTDLSPDAEAAFEAASKLATSFGAALTLLHVYDPSVPLPTADGEGLRDTDKVEDQLERKVEEVRARAFGDLGHHCKAAVVESHEVAEAICKYAEEHGIDLIVQAHRGTGALARLLIGSVAEEVVRHARCPVLTVRSSTD